MERRRAAGRALEAVVGAVGARVSRLIDGPERADDVDRLLERVDALAGAQAAAAHRFDPVPEGSGTQPELCSAAAEDVEARNRARDDRRVAKRQVENVRADAHATRPSGDERQQRPRVEEPRLMRMVLKGDEVEPFAISERREPDDIIGGVAARSDEDTELEAVPVVAHASEGSDRDSGDAAARLGRARPLTATGLTR